MLVVLLVVVLLFGANKLPKLARASGQAMGEFKKGREEIESELRAGVSDTTPADEDPLDDPVVETESESESETDVTGGTPAR
jgi:sec-independent protein translocase protein TatA